MLNMTGSTSLIRLDQLLVMRGVFASRSRARDAIKRGTISVEGRIITKAGSMMPLNVAFTLDDPAHPYVSRAALKLLAALDQFSIKVAGKNCLDIGASTGGFSQVLLERGAAHVVAVDVGHDQLHPTLRNRPDLTSLEGVNARALEKHHLGGHDIGLIVSDVSFISLKIALPPALNLAGDGAQALLLVKPQFEAGRKSLGRDGQLKDKTAGEKIAQTLFHWLDAQSKWQARALMPSPISGGKGAQEFLLYGVKQTNSRQT